MTCVFLHPILDRTASLLRQIRRGPELCWAGNLLLSSAKPPGNISVSHRAINRVFAAVKSWPKPNLEKALKLRKTSRMSPGRRTALRKVGKHRESCPLNHCLVRSGMLLTVGVKEQKMTHCSTETEILTIMSFPGIKTKIFEGPFQVDDLLQIY